MTVRQAVQLTIHLIGNIWNTATIVTILFNNLQSSWPIEHNPIERFQGNGQVRKNQGAAEAIQKSFSPNINTKRSEVHIH